MVDQLLGFAAAALVCPPELKVRTPAYAKNLGWYLEFEFRVTQVDGGRLVYWLPTPAGVAAEVDGDGRRRLPDDLVPVSRLLPDKTKDIALSQCVRTAGSAGSCCRAEETRAVPCRHTAVWSCSVTRSSRFDKSLRRHFSSAFPSASQSKQRGCQLNCQVCTDLYVNQ